MAGDIQGALQNAAGISDQKQKIDHYKLLLSSILCNNNVEHAKAFIDHSKLNSILLFTVFRRAGLVSI